MPPIPFADNFLAGSLLTILVPLGLLVAISIWYMVALKRVPEDTPRSSPTLPPPEVVAAAAPPTPEQRTPEPPAGQP